jgi:hypothetical protein
LSVPPVFVDGFTILSNAALYAAVVVLPPALLGLLLLPPALLGLLLLPLLLGVEPPLVVDVLLLQPLTTMAAAAMPIAADTIRCRLISCTSLFSCCAVTGVVRFLAELNGDGQSRRVAGLLPVRAPRPGSWTSRT